MPKLRQSSGSIMILLVLSGGVLLFLLMIAFTFNSLLFQRANGQDKVDALSLSLGELVNRNNRVGQMNQLLARSRELVFSSRKRLDLCPEAELDFAAPLCARLMAEARAGHQLLQQERKNQIKVICREIQDYAQKSNALAKERGGLKLACFNFEEPLAWKIDLGQVANIHSSVKCESLYSELAAHDRGQNYFLPASKLFKSGVDARLPAPDSDLEYKFSALPACVNNTCSSSRNINAEVFLYQSCIYEDANEKELALDETPSAVRVVCRMNTELADQHKLPIPLLSIGAVSGASTDPGQ